MITTHKKKLIDLMTKNGFEEHYKAGTLHHLGHDEADLTLLVLSCLVAVVGSCMIFAGMVPIIADQSLFVVLMCFIIIGFTFGMFIEGILHEQYLDLHHYVMMSTAFFVLSSVAMMGILWFFKNILSQYAIFLNDRPLLYLTFYLVSVAVPTVIFRSDEHGTD